MPLGWVQDNREKSGPENVGGDAQAMEGDKVKTARSPWHRAPLSGYSMWKYNYCASRPEGCES